MFSFVAELHDRAWKAKENILWEVNTHLIAVQCKCSFLRMNVWLPVSLALPLKSNRSAMLPHAKSSIYRSIADKGLAVLSSCRAQEVGAHCFEGPAGCTHCFESLLMAFSSCLSCKAGRVARVDSVDVRQNTPCAKHDSRFWRGDCL